MPHASWAAIFVDPRSCCYVDSLADACGIGSKTLRPVESRGSQFWDITDEITHLRPEKKKTTASKPPSPSGAAEDTPLALDTPAADMPDENESASSGNSEDISETEDSVLHTDVSAALETAEQLVAQFLQEQPLEEEGDPGPDPLATSTSPLENQAPVAPSLSPSGATEPHEETQSSEESDASTSDDDVSDIISVRVKKPYCGFITSNYHKEHSNEVRLSQGTPVGYFPPMTGSSPACSSDK